jgi:type I restriction enzyme S subunit
MKDWHQFNFKEITTKIGSGSTPTGGKDAYYKTGITLIRSLNIYDFVFEYKNLAFINESQAKKLNNATVEKDDILLNITGASVGRCTIMPKHLLPARVNQHVSIIRCDKSKAFPLFVLYSINSQSYKDALMSIADSGATREALTKVDIQKFKILLPCLKIQKKIATVLFAYDQLIQTNNKRIKLLEETTKELYKEWFIRMRFPGYKDVKFKKSIPESWRVEKLGAIIELAYGKALKDENRIEGNFPVYGSSGIVGSHNTFIINAPGIVVYFGSLKIFIQ